MNPKRMATITKMNVKDICNARKGQLPQNRSVSQIFTVNGYYAQVFPGKPRGNSDVPIPRYFTKPEPKFEGPDS